MHHVNPRNGRVGKCTAVPGNCPYGEDAVHGDTAELARIKYEESQANFVLPTPVTRSLRSPGLVDPATPKLTPTEMSLLTRRLKNQMLTQDFKRLHIDGSTPVTVVFQRATESSFDYRESSTQRTFTEGACALLAHEIHAKTGLPLTLITVNPGAKYWSGHVGVKIGPDEYLDINGVQSMKELQTSFVNASPSTNVIEDEVSLDTFRARMGLEPGVDVYRNLDRLERAMLDRLARDLVRDFTH